MPAASPTTPSSAIPRPTRHDARRGAGIGARAGLVARGLVYLLIGVIALRVALGDDPGTEADRQGALAELASHPGGAVLVWAIGIGFVGMTLWRVTEAVLGKRGPDGDGAAKRAGSAARAVVYAVAATSVLSFAIGHAGSSGDQQSRDLTARALALPAGPWLVGLTGLGIVIAGVVVAVQACRRKFRDHLDTHRLAEPARHAVDGLGIAGGLARGAVLAGVGVFVTLAARDYDPEKAKGMDDTLRSFAETPAGPWLLVAIAVGLALFGLFSLVQARYRRV
ncbi:DUF1206 domain-containing protein [Streptomyces sp. BI20]|uniref:DUF1206 domain-containing protein n=1 Tax=Streptomyces sp. BI20 TaxID=3403460 RepID=UPI003C73B0FD